MTRPPPAPASAAALSNATEALYRAALGPGRTAHYLPVFARFDERGVSGASWNHAAAWLNLNWLLYRRLWRMAALYVLLLALALGLWWWARAPMATWPPGVRWGLLAFIGVLAVVLPGWWGSGWLHTDVRSRMTQAVRRAHTVQEACQLLGRRGPGHWVWVPALLGQLALVGLLLSGPRPVAEAPRSAARPEPVLAQRLARAPRPAAPAPAAVPVPSEPPTPAVPTVPTVPTTPAAAPATVAPSAPPTPAVPAAPAAASATVAPRVRPAASLPPAPAAAETAAPRPRWQGHGVNVGLYGDVANAQRAVARLRQAGLPVQSDAVESARGRLTRVRVGPFERREQAEEAATAVKNLGLEARVFGP